MYSAGVVQEVSQRRWEPWRRGAPWLVTRSWQQREQSSRLILSYNYQLPKNSMVTILGLFSTRSKLERAKKLGKWVPYRLTENPNHHSTQQQIISRSDCDVWQKVDFIWQPAVTSSVAGPNSKQFPKPNSHQERSWWLFCHLLPVWSTTAFQILAKPLRLRSMLNKWVNAPATTMPAAAAGQQQGPSSPRQALICHATDAAQVGAPGCGCLICHFFTRSLANQLRLLQASW